MLELRNLHAGYPGRPVLAGLSAQFPAGKVTAVLGPNGCGKSTLLKALCGILGTRGEVLLEGRDLLALPQKQRARTVSYLAQGNRVPDMTAEELVLCGRFPYLRYPQRYRPEDLAAVQAALEQLDITHLKDRPMSQLSGGQQQKVHLAMALAQDAQVLLLDEPTTYLDVDHQLQLLKTAKELARAGKTVVMVIHDLPLALQWADHIVLLQAGQLIAQGTPEQVYSSGVLEQVFGIHLHRTPSQPYGYYLVP